MIGNTKHLSVQSFHRNQNLLEALNNYAVFLKLKNKGLDGKFEPDKIDSAKASILIFLKHLDKAVTGDSNMQETTNRLLGMDTRFKSLVNQFTDAKSKRSVFKSVLFRKSPQTLIDLITEENRDDSKKLIDSLTELVNLIEDHLATDTKDVIGNI